MVYNEIDCVNEPKTFAKVMKLHKECMWASLSIFVNIFENTYQILKIQTKYRQIFDICLKRSVLKTKIIFTDHCVISVITEYPREFFMKFALVEKSYRILEVDVKSLIISLIVPIFDIF